MAENEVSAERIILLGRERSYIDALRLALDMTEDLRVVAAEAYFDDAMRKVIEAKPSCVITDAQLDDHNTALKLLNELNSPHVVSQVGRSIPTMILTSYPTTALCLGASAFPGTSLVSRQRPITEVVRALRSTLRGSAVELGVCEDPFGLTRAELEVLELLVMGYNASTIADELHLSVHAIRARIRGLLTKTDSTSQLESVSKAIGAGVVAPPPLLKVAS